MGVIPQPEAWGHFNLPGNVTANDVSERDGLYSILQLQQLLHQCLLVHQGLPRDTAVDQRYGGDQDEPHHGGADVEDVRTAFNSPEIVKKWYSGNRPRGSAQADESPPTWKLEEIRGTISYAEIILAEGKPKVTSFSAREHHGYAYFQFKYEHSTFVEESWSVDMTMVETFEDGFIYKPRPLSLKVQGIHAGGSWGLPVGPGPGKHVKGGVKVDHAGGLTS